MRRASGVVMADLANTLGELDLKISEASVLAVIGDGPGRTQSSIGRRLGIQRANMAPLVAKLEQRGLVERTRSDGRSSGLSLTEAGSAIVERVRNLISQHEVRVFTALTPDEHELLRKLLAKIRSA